MSDEPKQRDDGGPAFPQLWNQTVTGADGVTHELPTAALGGMSLRDWFAGQAVVAFLQGKWKDPTNDDDWQPMPNTVAADAYKMADSMLAERGKR